MAQLTQKTYCEANRKVKIPSKQPAGNILPQLLLSTAANQHCSGYTKTPVHQTVANYVYASD